MARKLRAEYGGAIYRVIEAPLTSLEDIFDSIDLAQK